MATKAELERENLHLRKLVTRRTNQLEKLRTDAVEVGLRYADEHGWCDEIKNALTELGLGKYLPTSYRVEYFERGNYRSADCWHEYEAGLEIGDAMSRILYLTSHPSYHRDDLRIVQVSGAGKEKVVHLSLARNR